MEQDRTDYRTYPMDFTNIGGQSSVDRTPVTENRNIRPGIFSPSFQRQQTGVPQYGDFCYQDEQMMPSPVQSNYYSSFPSAPYHSEVRNVPTQFVTSTPRNIKNEVTERSFERQESAVRWKMFFIKWIVSILVLCTLIGIGIYSYPIYDIVCWLKENSVVIPTTVFILFLMSVIYKLLSQGEYEKDYIVEKNARKSVLPREERRINESNVKKKLKFDDEGDNKKDKTDSYSNPGNPTQQIPVKRTFHGSTGEVWSDFLRYYENIAGINGWNQERKRLVFLTTLRGQAEAYAHGLPDESLLNWSILVGKMESRFGHTNMKEMYIAEARLRKRKQGESFRDLGQAIEDLYRRAYPNSPDTVKENSIKTFLDVCGESEDFRMAIRRARPKTLQEAVTRAMEEECIRLTEQSHKSYKRHVYTVDKDSQQVKKSWNGKSNNPSFRMYKGQSYKPRNIVCYNCGKSGHYSSNCTNPPTDQGKAADPKIRPDSAKSLNVIRSGQ